MYLKSQKSLQSLQFWKSLKFMNYSHLQSALHKVYLQNFQILATIYLRYFDLCIEITDEASFDKACEGKPLCVVSVLPHILDCDAKCRNKFLSTLREMGEQYKKKLWGWAWAEDATQTQLEDSLEIGGFGYPAMAVVNFRAQRFFLLGWH